MRIYRHPVYNVDCNVWFNELPATLAGWRAMVPLRAPDLVSVCQLYYPRYGVGRWLHAWSESVQDTLLKSGFMELRLPQGTIIPCPKIVTPADIWTNCPLVECPRGSGRLYVVVMVDIAHIGFPNEYVVALLSQMGDVTVVARLGLGLGLGTSVNPVSMAARLGLGLGLRDDTTGAYRLAKLGIGLGLSAAVSPFTMAARLGLGLGLRDDTTGAYRLAKLGLGLGLSAAVNPSARSAALGLGLGLSAAVNPSARSAALGLGLGLQATINPSKIDAKLGLGLGLSAVVSNGGGSVTPGTTCATAGLVTLPFSQAGVTDTVNFQWFKANVTNGTVYHVRLTQAMMGSVNATVTKNNCSSPSFVGSLSSGSACVDFTMSGGGQLMVSIGPNLGGGQAYTLEIGTGLC